MRQRDRRAPRVTYGVRLHSELFLRGNTVPVRLRRSRASGNARVSKTNLVRSPCSIPPPIQERRGREQHRAETSQACKGVNAQVVGANSPAPNQQTKQKEERPPKHADQEKTEVARGDGTVCGEGWRETTFADRARPRSETLMHVDSQRIEKEQHRGRRQRRDCDHDAGLPSGSHAVSDDNPRQRE